MCNSILNIKGNIKSRFIHFHVQKDVYYLIIWNILIQNSIKTKFMLLHVCSQVHLLHDQKCKTQNRICARKRLQFPKHNSARNFKWHLVAENKPLVWVRGLSNKHCHTQKQYPPPSAKAPSYLKVFCVPNIPIRTQKI